MMLNSAKAFERIIKDPKAGVYIFDCSFLHFLCLSIENAKNEQSIAFSLFIHFRLRNDLYCVEWGVKLYSLTLVYPLHQAASDRHECRRANSFLSKVDHDVALSATVCVPAWIFIFATARHFRRIDRLSRQRQGNSLLICFGDNGACCAIVGSKSKGEVVQVTWDNVEELDAYIAKLKKAADQLSIENRQLRRCHFNISDKVTRSNSNFPPMFCYCT